MNILMTGASGFIGQRILAMRNELFDKYDNLFLITSKQIGDFPCLIHKDYTFTEDDLVKAGIGHIDVVLLIGHYVSERHNNNEVVVGNINSINNVVHLMDLLPNIPSTIVYCSSMSVYGSRVVAIDENTSPCPETPYALSKLMIESYLREWCMSKNGRGGGGGKTAHSAFIPHLWSSG